LTQKQKSLPEQEIYSIRSDGTANRIRLPVVAAVRWVTEITCTNMVDPDQKKILLVNFLGEP
jgi:hypothetical protein